MLKTGEGRLESRVTNDGLVSRGDGDDHHGTGALNGVEGGGWREWGDIGREERRVS
jgi:hypothetical protein